MKRFRMKLILLAGIAVVATGAVALAWRQTLVINGKSTTADIRTINGSAYIKLADIAKALDMTVVKGANGRYELIKSGGANQVSGMQGKIGDTLFDGKWRFTLVSLDTPSTYQMKTDAEPYDSAGRTAMDAKTRLISPAKGYSLVVMQCRIVNGVKERRTLWTAISDDRIRTSIADTSGSSHPPVAYDFKGGPIQTEWLLPGAQLSFAVIFSVPEGTQLKDLIFTLKNNQTSDKPNDLRVSLSKS